VTVDFSSYSPYVLDAVPGDTVTWTNSGGRTHTVTADDLSFDSGDLVDGHSFSHTFAALGTYTYHCTIHRAMYGEVDVRPVTLEPLPQRAAAHSRVVVSGRTADPATPVAVQTDAGSGFRTVATVSPQADGSWRAALNAASTVRVRASSGAGVSETRQLLVMTTHIGLQVGGRRIAVTVAPEAPGALVALQYLLRDRFGWWPVAVQRLSEFSDTTFRTDHGGPVRARVVLLAADHWTVLGISRVVRLSRR
jgi:hypothetical protein